VKLEMAPLVAHVGEGVFAEGHHGDDVELEGLLDDV
jgi:hypothetical protein